MNRLEKKVRGVTLRSHRTRSKTKGTEERPRLTVHVTNLHVYAQIINDVNHKTLASATTVGQKGLKGTMTEKAAWIGEQIAKNAKAAKVNKVVFDRGAKQYHGRVKALADAARNGGLEF
ncbi:50S ribosomal protein L18 [Candidatus Saccharibacteria bacterium]|nr:50S ribosomal protein L18 [Candidatus Saccharibacteria bacterium]